MPVGPPRRRPAWAIRVACLPAPDHFAAPPVAAGVPSWSEGPTRPSRLGIVLEEAFCDVLMMHPPAVASCDELLAWADRQASTVAEKAMRKEAQHGMTFFGNPPSAWDGVSRSIEEILGWAAEEPRRGMLQHRGALLGNEVRCRTV